MTIDYERGIQAVTYFHNEMARTQRLYGYDMSRDEMIRRVSESSRDKNNFWIEDLGFAIREIGMAEYQVKSAMELLADTAPEGKVPGNKSVFFKALSDRMQDISTRDWAAVLPEVVGTAAVGAVGMMWTANTIGELMLLVQPAIIVTVAVMVYMHYDKQWSKGK